MADFMSASVHKNVLFCNIYQLFTFVLSD